MTTDVSQTNERFHAVAKAVRQVILARTVEAATFEHRPFSEQEAGQFLDTRVKEYSQDGLRLADAEVGRFYAALQDDEDLFDLFHASVLAEYTRPELLTIDTHRIAWEVTVRVGDMDFVKCEVCGGLVMNGAETCTCPPIAHR